MSSPKAAAAKPARKAPSRTAGKTRTAAKAARKPAKAAAKATAKTTVQTTVKTTVKETPNPAVDTALTADAKRLAAAIERSVTDGRPEALGADALQALLGALCRAYSARVEKGDKVLPLASRTAVSPTDVMHTASGLLRGADLQVFELGMWQSWTGR